MHQQNTLENFSVALSYPFPLTYENWGDFVEPSAKKVPKINICVISALLRSSIWSTVPFSRKFFLASYLEKTDEEKT